MVWSAGDDSLGFFSIFMANSILGCSLFKNSRVFSTSFFPKTVQVSSTYLLQNVVLRSAEASFISKLVMKGFPRFGYLLYSSPKVK